MRRVHPRRICIHPHPEAYMASKRPQTMAKRAREQAVKEKRERKHEKKAAAAAARNATAAEETPNDTAPE
jgi:hypothetical protein